MHQSKLKKKETDEKVAFDKQWATERAQRSLIEERKAAELQAERVRHAEPPPYPVLSPAICTLLWLGSPACQSSPRAVRGIRMGMAKAKCTDWWQTIMRLAGRHQCVSAESRGKAP
jgi:hypothetical protein